jgi:hypothetical protein
MKHGLSFNLQDQNDKKNSKTPLADEFREKIEEMRPKMPKSLKNLIDGMKKKVPLISYTFSTK